jgi:predicted membrane channel-forming protein YqfA (hemolysin III family)
MDAAKADLMRALGRLVRGLSTLFWGIPLVLAADVETARTNWLGAFGPLSFAPALALSALLWHGLRQLRDFQRQERVWRQALDRAEIFAVVNTGLAPFLFWWHRFPSVPFYCVCVNFLAVAGYLFLMQLNQVLRRLAAMLPDETLRTETRTFVSMNTWMLAAALAILAVYLAWTYFHGAPRSIGRHLVDLQTIGEWLVLFLTLMPTAVTLALLWKIKEAIFTSFFEIER